MNPEVTTKSFPCARVYRIRIEGSLDPSWSDRLGGLAITSTGRVGARTTTLLEGELQDQAALIGVLNTLYELRFPLESVEGLQPNPAEPAVEISPSTS